MTYRKLDAIVEIQVKKLEEQEKQIKEMQEKQRREHARNSILKK